MKRYSFILMFSFHVILPGQSYEDKLPVYQNGKQIGELNTYTDFKCESCYALIPVKIFKCEKQFKVPVSSYGINDRLSLQANFELSASKKNKKLIALTYSNRNTSDSYTFEIVKQRNKDSKVISVLKTASSVYSQKTEEEVIDYPSTLICEKGLNINLNDFELSENYFEDYDQNCFHCPIKYGINECLEFSNKESKFDWEQ